jgi:hypothetical protein
MKGIKGQLSSLPLTDLMQWIDMNKKSGILFFSDGKTSRCFCFEEGKLLLAGGRSPGRRFGDVLAKEGAADQAALRAAVNDCRSQGAPLMGYLMERKVVPEEFLKVCIQQIAEESITDILSWEGGTFEFREELPPILQDSPLKLSTNFIIFEAVRRYDELQRQMGIK